MEQKKEYNLAEYLKIKLGEKIAILEATNAELNFTNIALKERIDRLEGELEMARAKSEHARRGSGG